MHTKRGGGGAMEREYVNSLNVLLLFFFALYTNRFFLSRFMVHSTFPCRFSIAPSLLYTSASFYHFVSKQFEVMNSVNFMQLQAMLALALNFRFALVFDNNKIEVKLRNKLTLC